MCDVDKGIMLLGFARPLCQNAFIESPWSRATTFCFTKIHWKAVEEILEWIRVSVDEFTSLVMSTSFFTDFCFVLFCFSLGRGYYWEQKIHLAKGSWWQFLHIKFFLWDLINRSCRHPIRKRKKKKEKKKKEKKEGISDKTTTQSTCKKHIRRLWCPAAGKRTMFRQTVH